MKMNRKARLLYGCFFSLCVMAGLSAHGHGERLQTASISGSVVFEGAPPTMKAVHMQKEPFCAFGHRKHVQHEETIVVNPNHTLRYVVVYLIGGSTKNIVVPPPVVLDQYDCWFKPHVLAVMIGQRIKAINDDPGILHNLHFMSKVNPSLNFGEPGEASAGKIPSRLVVFHHAEMIPLICDIHPWMRAIVAVLPNPYFSVTKEDGSFSIPNVPPGTYLIKAWHETLGKRSARITVLPDTRRVINFVF